MSELTLTVIQLGFLAVLWLFVVTALSVMRTDIFGARGAYQGEQGGQGGGRATGQQAAEAAAQSRRNPHKLIVTGGALHERRSR